MQKENEKTKEGKIDIGLFLFYACSFVLISHVTYGIIMIMFYYLRSSDTYLKW